MADSYENYLRSFFIESNSVAQIVNGKFLDENILVLAESLATSSQEMQDSMAAVSICGSKSRLLFQFLSLCKLQKNSTSEFIFFALKILQF